MYTIKVIPKVKIFYNTKNQFGIYKCTIDEILNEEKIDLHVSQHLIIKGECPELELESKIYILNCVEKFHEKFGLQYEIVSMYEDTENNSNVENEDSNTENLDIVKNIKTENLEKVKTSSLEIQKAFLKELVTPRQYHSITSVYDYCIDVIVNDEFDYRQVYDFGKFRYGVLRNKVLSNLDSYEIIAKYGEYGLKVYQAKLLNEIYGSSNEVIKKINENPYDVLMNLPGMWFSRVDKFAMDIGIEFNDPRRINACFEYFLEKINKLGHVWADINEVISDVKDFINDENFDENEILDIVKNSNNLMIVDDYKLVTKRSYEAEIEIKNELLRIRDAEINKKCKHINKESVENFIKKQEKEQGFEYDEIQKECFVKVLENNIFVLTGGAGSGKTVLTNGILNLFDNYGLTYKLMSFSAKAAKVLENYTQRKASTIHRGLGWTPMGFEYNADNKLPYDVIVIDEVSFVGIYLFRDLLNAIEDGTKLILIGDPYQIPSIDIGSILDDIINSNKFSCIKLTKVFRQAEDSGILNIAIKTRDGEYFLNNSKKIIKFGLKNDAIFIPTNKENTLDCIIKLYKQLLISKNYTDEDIMVVMPKNVGQNGTVIINNLLQEINNPPDITKKEIKYYIKKKNSEEYDNNKIRYFREGDKVLHIVNDYKKEWYDLNYELIEDCCGIFNGDMGRVIRIDYDDSGNRQMWVRYDNKLIKYGYFDLDNILHAWSLSVHKMQGSQAKAIIFGLDKSNSYNVKRNLIYTAITRASEQLVLVGESWVYNLGIDNDEVFLKRTFLKDLLDNE